MRRFFSAALGAALLTGLWSSHAVAQQISVDVPVRVAPPVVVQPAQPAVVNNDWRFKMHNGNWWYWTPENQWMVYRNSAWERYETVPTPGALPLPAPVIVTPAPVVTTSASVLTTSPVVAPPVRLTPFRPFVGPVVRPRYRW